METIFVSQEPCCGKDGASCCGQRPGERSGPDERPGYALCAFVDKFGETPVGRVPQVKTRLGPDDWSRAALARAGIARDRHRVAPGLYSVGNAGPQSPVLVTANYRLSFDALRKELGGLDAWILVVDTLGVNVWCAAGKGTFSADEVASKVQQTGLDRVVEHRRLILPQLSATGVCARHVRQKCGFEVAWGPIRARDIRQFLQDGMKTSAAMRSLTFSFYERLVLVPVEVSLILKPALVILLALFVLSGIGPGVFSFSGAWTRGMMMAWALALAILAGAVATPLLLPKLPGTAFSAKGAVAGLGAALIAVILFFGQTNLAEILSLTIFIVAFGSYIAMNFTGATPFTSPSGVEKEMRKALPFQGGAALLALVLWIGAAF